MSIPSVETRASTAYVMHGIRLGLHTDRPLIDEVLAGILAYYGATVAMEPWQAPKPTDVNLSFCTCEALPSLPERARLSADFGGARVWVANDGLWVDSEGLRARVEPEAGRAHISVLASTWQQPRPLDQGQIIPIVLSLMLLMRHRGLFAMHAAGVARNGLGCLFIAAGGCGKSTQALGAVSAGWDHLSDDSLLLRPSGTGAEGGVVEALSLRQDFYLLDDSVANFPALRGHWQTCPLTAGVKRCLNMSKVFPRQIAQSCVPRVLVFPRIVDAETSRLESYDRGRAFLALLRQSDLAAVEPKDAPQHVAALKALLNQTVSVELLAGRDLKTNPARVAPLLERAFSGLSEERVRG